MSDNVNIAVVYYSSYGTNHRMAEIAVEAARKAGAEVRLLKTKETAPQEVIDTQDAWKAQQEKTKDIPEATPEDMVWADAYFFSVPTRYGVAASQVRAFIDTLGPVWQEGKLADKPATAMASAQNPHGGQEMTILSMYTTFLHWGSIIVAPGYTDERVFESGGNPYGTSVTATGNGVGEADADAIRHQAERLVAFAKKLKG
jgi:NAD(P)H dehydrogenase (quinone)